MLRSRIHSLTLFVPKGFQVFSYLCRNYAHFFVNDRVTLINPGLGGERGRGVGKKVEFEQFDPQKGIFEGFIGWELLGQQILGTNRVSQARMFI